MSKVKLRITKTKNGSKYLGVDFVDDEGRRQRKSLGLPATKENIRKAENHIIPKMLLALEENTSEFFQSKMLTVDEFIHTSIEMHKSYRNEDTTADYKSIYKNHIKSVFGHKRIYEIKPSDLKKWQSDLITIKKLSPSRVKTVRKVMSRLFNDAIDDEIIDKNPLLRVRAPRVAPPEIQPFKIGEIKILLSNAEGQFKNFLATAFFTGARSGELIGLKWEDIDFEKKEITIRRSIKMGLIRLPKTINSIRTIDMIDTLIPFLKEQYERTADISEFVFINKEGNHYYDIKRLRNTYWKKLLAKCDFKYRPIYHTRHSFATMMIENEDILWVANMMGHIDSTTTLSKYARYMKKPHIKRGVFLNSII
ncbi:tyrosine-type recombinase/integrase [Halarcobacter sp.]|uniref:tyrosine-type recombinase/integrase n=1 Tax=Halarcobacter sp. TaxID=2321133 RepID=UPI003A8E17BA